MTVGTNDGVLLSSLHFGTLRVPGMRTVNVDGVRLRDAWRVRADLRMVFCANPSIRDLLDLFLIRMLVGHSVRIALFDVVVRRPRGLVEHLMLPIKRLFVRSVDKFYCIHKDMRGFASVFAVPESRLEYVAFKANNLDLTGEAESVDGGYILSCGASQRDFQTLVEAVRPLGFPTKIVLSDRAARNHNARLDVSTLPPFVEHVREPVDRQQYNALMARARMVVIPILPDVVQAAGISVYLEAMAWSKPVVITTGVSTEGILDDSLAVCVSPASVADLRAAIESLWPDKARQQTLGAAGRAYAVSLGDNERLLRDLELALTRLAGTPGAATSTHVPSVVGV